SKSKSRSTTHVIATNIDLGKGKHTAVEEDEENDRELELDLEEEEEEEEAEEEEGGRRQRIRRRRRRRGRREDEGQDIVEEGEEGHGNEIVDEDRDEDRNEDRNEEEEEELLSVQKGTSRSGDSSSQLDDGSLNSIANLRKRSRSLPREIILLPESESKDKEKDKDKDHTKCNSLNSLDTSFLPLTNDQDAIHKGDGDDNGNAIGNGNDNGNDDNSDVKPTDTMDLEIHDEKDKEAITEKLVSDNDITEQDRAHTQPMATIAPMNIATSPNDSFLVITDDSVSSSHHHGNSHSNSHSNSHGSVDTTMTTTAINANTEFHNYNPDNYYQHSCINMDKRMHMLDWYFALLRWRQFLSEWDEPRWHLGQDDIAIYREALFPMFDFEKLDMFKRAFADSDTNISGNGDCVRSLDEWIFSFVKDEELWNEWQAIKTQYESKGKDKEKDKDKDKDKENADTDKLRRWICKSETKLQAWWNEEIIESFQGDNLSSTIKRCCIPRGVLETCQGSSTSVLDQVAPTV
ncbi:hypothetical protein RFI_17401, partial [Reticulomyxa filosa]